MKTTRVSANWLYKVIAVMMVMTIATVMPATAGNKPRVNSHADRVDRRTSHFDNHRGHAYRPDVKTCTFKVSRHDSHREFVSRVEHIKGVMDTKWNPRTREVTVVYDGKVTSARHIRHFMHD